MPHDSDQTTKPRIKYAPPQLLKVDAPTGKGNGTCFAGSGAIAGCSIGTVAVNNCGNGITPSNCTTGSGE
ncbi:MAG TPA: hypothetical protein QGH10_21215 [Armatimonadota bacterium]|nr:hypothetical protein [Armatimonadota bacterium]